jgi:hypothetical protein
MAEGSPFFTDGAHWYNDACRWLRLKHTIYGTELKNIMERFIHNRSRIGLNVSMTIIFLAGRRRKIAICSMCGTS